MNLLDDLLQAVIGTVNALTTAVSSIIGALLNVLGTLKAAATGIAGYLVSAVGGSVYAVFPFLGIVTATIGFALQSLGFKPPSIPVPNPIARVTTDSGNVHKVSYVPIAGIPVAIDVDNGEISGALTPDINVAVGLLNTTSTALEKPIEPWVTIEREPFAAKSGAPAPSLKIAVRIELKDAFNGFDEIATIDYGYDTPRGGRVPPLVKARLTGPMETGWVDPLKASVETPGYSGPLKLEVNASTPDVNADFGAKFSPMPTQLNIVEDPREDGMDLHFDHSGPIPDVKLDADVNLLTKSDGSRMLVGAVVERLPRTIDLSNTNTLTQTFVDYRSQTALPKADVEATYQDFAGDGALIIDADIKVGALPDRMQGTIVTAPNGQGGSDMKSADFRVLDGEEIGSVDFLVRNFLGAPGPVPEPNLGPRQFVTLGMRRLDDGSQRFRAAGRIKHIRGVTFARTGADDVGYDVRTDLGHGTEPLRAIVDIDGRGPGVTDGKRFKLDTTLRPLPRQIHAVYLPGATPGDPTSVTYDANQPLDATAAVELANGPANGCGAPKVTCAKARIDKVPTHLALTLPGIGGTDYAVSHNGGGTQRPDVRAIVDNTPEIQADRVWAQLEALRMPGEVRARLDSSPEHVLRGAEFHACAWDYAAGSCTDTQQALGRVRFKVRNDDKRPATLPRRPDQAPTFVSLIRRFDDYEIEGRVDEIRNVFFRQRDANADGKADGTVAVKVDAGVGGAFDAHVDQLAPDTSRPEPRPSALTILDAHVAKLPTIFHACFRQPDDAAPPNIARADALLGPCDRRDVLGRTGDDLTTTPLAIYYNAKSSTPVDAHLTTRSVDPDDKDGSGNPLEHTRRIDVDVDAVPEELRADVITPKDDAADASKARPLEARYEASAAIDRVDLTMDNHRTDRTPAPNGSYVEVGLEGVPSRVSAKVDAARKVLRRADFHACDYDYGQEGCADAQQALGDVRFLTRPQRRRGALPAVPEHADSYVSLIRRLGNFEVSGHVAQIRNVSFRQRDLTGDGEADGTLGVLVDAGVGGPFDAHIDQVALDGAYRTAVPQPTAAQVIDARVDDLPPEFKACFRESADARPADPSDLPDDALLEPCDRDALLGYASGALPATPLTIDYDAKGATKVTATVRTEAQSKDDEDRRRVSNTHVVVDKVPGKLHADLIPGRDVVAASGPDPEQPARALQFNYGASGKIDHLDFALENRRVDESHSDADLFAKATVSGIPAALSGEVDSARKVVRRAEFHACPFDFTTRACTSPSQQIDDVRFTVRPHRRRGSLPPQETTDGAFLSLVKRFANSEITGRIPAIRDVAFHQRDERGGGPAGDKPDGKPDGTLGVDIGVGNGGAFDAHIDQVARDEREELEPLTGAFDASSVLDVHVDALPTSLKACLRSPHEGTQPPVSPDPLLADCDASPLTTTGDEPAATPLALVYRAKTPTKVRANMRSVALDTQDRPNADDPISDANKPFEHTTKLDITVDKVPGFVRADMMPKLDPKPTRAARRLQLAYDSDLKIDEITFGLEDRRTGSLCLDPRSNRSATCMRGRVTNIPKHLDATFDPDQTRGTFAFNTNDPAQGDPLLSIHDLVYRSTAPDSKGKPMKLRADVLGIPPHITGRFAQFEPKPGEKEPAVVKFDGCPQSDECPGIQSIDFTATNALLESALPGVPAAPEANVTQEFSLVQRGSPFRAQGKISNLKEISYSRLPLNKQSEPATAANIKETKRIRAAFGASATEKIRTYLDTDSGTGTLKLDGVIAQAPKAVNLCLRDAVDKTSADPYLPSGDSCDVARKNALAVSARLESPADNVKPDVRLHTLRVANPTGTEVLTGKLTIDDLGHRIDATIDKGKETGVLVEGRDGNGNLANVAGRVTFDLRNFDGVPSNAFPFKPMAGNTDPPDDSRNDDSGNVANSGRNYVVVAKNFDFLQLKGSIPAVKRVGIAPGACDPSDTTYFPDPKNPAWPSGTAPEYTCVRAAIGEGRPLGAALRLRDAEPGGTELLAVEEGHINAVPTGGDGLAVTISKTPSQLSDAPSCSTAQDAKPPFTSNALPCKPELLSLTSTPSGGTPKIEGRVFIGPESLVDELGKTPIVDPIAARANYDQRPRDFAEDGIRVRVGSKKPPGAEKSLTAIRMGLSIPIPRFLDVDTPTFYSCDRKQVTSACVDSTGGGDKQRTSASDIFLKIVAADDARFGGPACSGGPGCYLGRLAVNAHNFVKKTDIFVTGAPPADTGNGTSNSDPNSPAGPGAHDRGMQLPRHVDTRLQIRENHSGDDPHFSTTYLQADARLSAPVSLMARLPRKPHNINKDNQPVPEIVATVRNLAGLGEGVNDYTQPTQRARLVLMDKEEDPGFFDCRGAGIGVSIPALAHACLITPHPHMRWANVDLSADPDGAGTGGPPARDVEAVIDLRDNNEIEMKGFGDLAKTIARPFGVRAGLRLEPFALGARVGGGIGLVGGYLELTLDGDLVVKASNGPSTRLRASNNAGAIEIASKDGKARADVDLRSGVRAKLVGEVLFGLAKKTLLNVATPRIPLPVSFRKCKTGGLFGTVNFFESDDPDGDKAGMTLGAQFPASLLASGPVSLLLDALPPAFCVFFGTNNNSLIDAFRPAPGYEEPGRPVTDTAHVIPTPPPAGPPPTDPIPPSITVGGTRTECGTLNVKNLTIQSGGQLVVGGQGCNGRLTIIAENVDVQSGGRITASSVIDGQGPGTPAADGAGAGHAGAGGKAGNNAAGGGTYAIGPDGIDGDIGSPARGSRRGRGGGAIAIYSRHTIRVAGSVTANGGNGGVGGPSCADLGGGGGSGGAVHLAANVVNVLGGTVSAHGGVGGSGGHGGGGGGGGRISVDRIALRGGAGGANGTISAEGRGGGAGPSCTAGSAGAHGGFGPSTALDRGAGVEEVNVNNHGFVRGTAQLALTGVQDGGGPMVILVCSRSKPPGTPDGFTHADLDPGTRPVSQRLGEDNCRGHHFNAPTDPDGVTYRRTVNASLSDGFYGFYVLAADPAGSGLTSDCEDPTPIIGNPCDYQDVLPQTASVRLASDDDPPTNPTANPFVEVSGSKTDCHGGASCQTSHTGVASIVPADNFSGFDSGECRVNGSGGDPFGVPQCHGAGIAVPLGNLDGEKRVDVRVRDRAGNQVTFEDVLFWRVDSAAPPRPTILITPKSGESLAAQNGWFHEKPNVSVLVGDGSASVSGGFGDDPIEFFVGGSGSKCGGPKTDPPAVLAICSVDSLQPQIPSDGTHRLDAIATDRLGNESLPADDPQNPGDDKVIKVDKVPPDTKLFLGPETPDGAAGWYRVNPVIAFATSDTPGGSGVDITGATSPSGVWFSIDGGAPVKFDPDGADQVVPDGMHKVCWFAVDIANNREPQECRQDIKVDGGDPSPQATITPAAPDGSNGWWATQPTFALSGGDSVSGIDRTLNPASGIFVSIDGERFERYDGSAANVLTDGDRELCWYAVDVAGNLGGDGTHDASSCRRLRVDSTRPPTTQTYVDPPRPDGLAGWYVTRPVLDFAQRDKLGASGGEASGTTAPSGMRFRVDGGPYEQWDPGDDAANTLADGIHDVCWRSVDIAGNGQTTDSGCQVVKVDATAPKADAPIVPVLPNGANSWYTAQPAVSPAGADASPGSGLARVEAQVDGGPWTVAPLVDMPAGEHDIRVRAVDNAGNHSPMLERVVRYDDSDPAAHPGTYPPRANTRGWFRQPPSQSVAVEDGRDGSGEDSATYLLDGIGPASYLEPFLIEEGRRHLEVRPRDLAGRVGPSAISDPLVDLTPPAPVPVGQPNSILLPFQNTELKFDVPDNLSRKVKVRIMIYDKLGQLIRDLPVPGDADGYVPAGPGSSTWDGTTATGTMTFPTVAHYRVQAIDEAGNTAQSTEGKPFLIGLTAGTL